MRAGDIVMHRPSGETWVVASVTDDGDFFACGWPETRAHQADAELVTAATDEEHVDLLRRVAASRDDAGGFTSARASWARQNLRGVRP